MKFTLKNNELTATRTLDFFESLIVEAIKAEDEMPQEAQEDIRKGVYYLVERLDNEMRGTSLQLADNWFAGLAVHVPYMNHDILERATAFGILSDDASAEQASAFLLSYFSKLGEAFLGLRHELKI